MEIFALFMLCGLLTTFLIPETARKSLEELSGEGVEGGAPTATTEKDSAEGDAGDAEEALKTRA